MNYGKEFTKLRQHEVVICEQLGDTLVLSPQGDLQEFSGNSFDEELTRIRKIAADQSVSNIICDFAAKSYFSQGLVIPLIGLRDQVRTRGRFVVSGLSDEMSKLFEHSESGTHLLQYPTRHDAIRAVATVSWLGTFRASIRRHRRAFLGCGAVVTLGLLAIAWMTFGEELLVGSRAEQLYQQLEIAWDDARNVANSNPTKANWNGLGDRFLDSMYKGVIEIRQLESATPAELAVAAAANQIQMMSQDPRSRVEMMQDRFLNLAEKARVEIEAEDDVTLRKLEPIEFPSF